MRVASIENIEVWGRAMHEVVVGMDGALSMVSCP